MNSAIDISPIFRRKHSIRSSIKRVGDRWRASAVGKRKRTGVAPSGTAAVGVCNAPAPYEITKKMCFGQTNAGCELDESECPGTLNLAFEDFPDEENSVNEIILESILKNGDRPKRTVKSVTFGEELKVRRFSDFKSSEQFRNSKLNFINVNEDGDSSTENLLKRNYELLTKERRNDVENDLKVDETSKEEPSEIVLPVVSLYFAADRMPSRKKKSKEKKAVQDNRGNGGPWNALEGNSGSCNALQHPLQRSHRLAKMVKKFGPEILSCMEDGSDSVLAQFMKNQELERIKEIEKAKWEEENKVSPVVRKRKAGEEVFEGTAGTDEGMELGRGSSRKKLHHIDIHLHALFAAVEHGHVDKAKTILESTDVDVNSLNSDGLSPLDVAVLSNNRPLTKVLIAFGAQEGNQFGTPESLAGHLRQLACEAERRVSELGGGSGGHIDAEPRSAPPYVTPINDKTLCLWERRAKGLNKMILGFDQARPPDIPFLVAVDVTGTNSVSVRYQEPEHHDSPVCTKFRVEWSTDNSFHNIFGYKEILDTKQLECHVDNLDHGQRYYFRVACGNIRGFGNYRPSTPESIIPSSWRDVTHKEERLSADGLALLDRLFTEVRSARPDLKGVGDQIFSGDTPGGQRRKKTTIKQLFTAASKFQKHLRRGVYLSCLLYHEDRVLVTNEDFLPVIEVDETYPGSIYHDFHWLLKIACTWDDVKWLRQDMEKSLSSSAVHFRIKLLQAAAQMQTALSIQDLGQLYHKPVRDSEGTIVISTVNYVRSPKSVSVLNSRWLPLGKLTKRAAPPTTDANVADILMASIQEQITYHQVSSIRLPRGLYLGYLKMRSSVDLLQVLVPSKTPNVPPHCKIRDNPHVTAEEWESLICGEVTSSGSEHQRVFVEQVAATARRLFTYMEVSTDEAPAHRLYDAEVVELSRDVSFLMAVPAAESACSAPGQREMLLQRPDLLPLPVQVFEMVHLGTYQKQVVSRYSRLSCILELDTVLAQHSHREAFSNSELNIAKERLSRLESLQAQLNAAWKQSRWLLDVLSFARDRLSHSPTSMRHLLALHPKRSRDQLDSHSGLLQPPDPKAVKSRGSWPGPGVARLLGTVTAELSRSEQHLSGMQMPCTPVQPNPPPLPPPRPSPPRIPTESDQDSPRLPPSRSEDTLVMHSRVITPHTRTRCSVSATTSPLLPIRPGYGSGSLHSLSSDDSAVANQSKSEGEEEGATVPAPAPGILQVYAAYDTGLASGTSLKLHVSPRTSAREVVDLVVKQLNMAVVLKGKDGPIYPAEHLQNFCLVAVIGARERCLRDDFKPLQLQNPWKKGRLYVRQKHDVLAALEHSSRHSAYL